LQRMGARLAGRGVDVGALLGEAPGPAGVSRA
jgi:hypothetical protein